jgi:hypothetical protein
VLVYGFGEGKTPEPFVAACDKIVYTELLRPQSDSESKAKTLGPNALEAKYKHIRLLRDSVHAASDDAVRAYFGAVGSNIATRSPEFDSRDFGYAKLRGLLLLATQLFDEETRRAGNGTHYDVYVRGKGSLSI